MYKLFVVGDAPEAAEAARSAVKRSPWADCFDIIEVESGSTLGRALQGVEDGRKSALTLQFGGTVAVVPVSDIIYIESKRRKIEVHTSRENYEAYATMAEVLDQLPEQFFQCHKSYIANFDYVAKMDAQGLTLQNGEQVPVSQRRRQDTREHFFRYLGKE